MTGADLPDPMAVVPIAGVRSIAYLAPLAEGRANVSAGAYSYVHDPVDPTRFFEDRVRHHYPHMGDRLEIGRFCAIAEGAVFVMNGANHLDGGTTYPFEIFPGWGVEGDRARWAEMSKGDTVVGDDVWIGAWATVMPGVTVGSGAVIGTHAVVASDVAPYAVVAGNPARVVRKRFGETVARRLLEIAWWDWSADKIRANLPAIRRADINALETA